MKERCSVLPLCNVIFPAVLHNKRSHPGQEQLVENKVKFFIETKRVLLKKSILQNNEINMYQMGSFHKSNKYGPTIPFQFCPGTEEVLFPLQYPNT